MDVEQIHELVNSTTQEVLGESGVVENDLSNIVDVGKAVFDADATDNFVKGLVNRIGRTVFRNRAYNGGVPSVLMDSWEFGSVMQKITADLPSASENESWNLEDGETYDPDVFIQPKVTAKFYNSRVTFEIPLSFTEKQVKESFNSAEQMNSFLSMLTTSVENSMTVKLDSLIQRTISNMIAETLHDEGIVNNPGETGVKAVNLLKLYNEQTNSSLGKDEALTDADFIRFATYHIGVYRDRLQRMSTLFNIEERERFTPAGELNTVLLSDFARASAAFLQSTTYNQDMVALPAHDAVPYWQGSGESYNFEDISRINLKAAQAEETIDFNGIIGCMFDRYALGVSNLDRRVTSNYNPKGEFYTNFYKFDAGYFNDLSENFVVFFIGEEQTD